MAFAPPEEQKKVYRKLHSSGLLWDNGAETDFEKRATLKDAKQTGKEKKHLYRKSTDVKYFIEFSVCYYAV